VKRSNGRSGSSESAPVGQAETQDRHSVQPGTSVSTAPNGAPAGNGSVSAGSRRDALQLAQREAQHPALAALRQKTRRHSHSAARLDGAKVAAEHQGIVGLDQRQRFARETEPRQDRAAKRHRVVQAANVVARAVAHQRAHRRGAISNSGGERLKADLRYLVDRKG